MIKAERHRKIQALVEKTGAATVAELAASFDISPITIRRDLEELHEKGLLRRTHGGAVGPDGDSGGSLAPITPYVERERTRPNEKELIAREAAKLVRSGDSLIMNAGTTMRRMATALRDRKDLKIITNGLTVATELVNGSGAHVLLIGGVVDFTKMATVGVFAQDALTDTHVPRAFLGVSGISVAEGLLMFNPQEAEINKRFIASAREVTVLVDSTKFRSQAMYRIAPITKVHRIISDAELPSEEREKITKLGIELVLVGTRAKKRT